MWCNSDTFTYLFRMHITSLVPSVIPLICQWNNQAPEIEHFLSLNSILQRVQVDKRSLNSLQKCNVSFALRVKCNSHKFETGLLWHSIHFDYNFRIKPWGTMLTPKNRSWKWLPNAVDIWNTSISTLMYSLDSVVGAIDNRRRIWAPASQPGRELASALRPRTSNGQIGSPISVSVQTVVHPLRQTI